MKLLVLFKGRADLNAEHRVLSGSGRGRPSPVNETEVRPRAAKAMAELDVYVDVSGSEASEIETGIVRSLNKLGFGATAGAARGSFDIVVEGKLNTKRLKGRDSRWKWARSSVTVSIKDGRDSRIFSRFDASNRQASIDFTEAARRSRVNLAKKVSKRIDSAIREYFENQ